MLKDLKPYIGKGVKDFVNTPIKNEFVIIFEDNTTLWFHEGPYAVGSVRELEKEKMSEEKKNLCRYFNSRPWTREMVEMVFRRRRKPRKQIRCYICGLEKEMTFGEFAEHVRGHIKNGEVSDGIVGECMEWSGKDETRTSAVAEGKD